MSVIYLFARYVGLFFSSFSTTCNISNKFFVQLFQNMIVWYIGYIIVIVIE